MAAPRGTPPRSFVPTDDVPALYAQKLASSGLSAEDGAMLGLAGLSAPEVKALGASFWGVPALRLPYYDLAGRPLLDGGQPFYRLRWLRQPPTPVGEAREPPRYLQLPGTLPHAYLPPSVEWRAVAHDVADELLITEGELKAAAATKHGFPTIGLGGVDSFRSLKLGLLLLPELEQVTWVRRRVTIIYDSDVVEKPAVCRALMALAEELAHRGARPDVVFLPPLVDDGKTGLDDYLLERGALGLRQLVDEEAAPLTLARHLWQLNKRYAWVGALTRVVSSERGAILEDSSLARVDTARYPERALLPGGKVTNRLVPALPVWVTWPLRRAVDELCYEPGLPPRADVSLPAGPDRPRAVTAYNLWPGWGCEPAAKATERDVAPFLRVMRHLFTDAPPASLMFLLRWLAYPLQFPGSKLKSSCMVWGLAQGTGKSLIGYTMRRIYGASNFSEINERDFHGPFNEWCAHKQFVLGDDVSGSDKKADREVLKKMITQQSLSINIKYKPLYTIRDCVNYLWTSNQPDALMLEDDDRRFFVHRVLVNPLPDEFYKSYFAWLDGTGVPLVFRYLLDLDLGDFSPDSRAPRTVAKDAMTSVGRNEVASWVRDVREHPDGILRSGAVVSDRALWTAAQLLALYDPEGRTRASPQVLTRELARAGVPLAAGGARLTPIDGGPPAPHFAVRDHERWATASEAEAARHLAGPAKKATKGRKM